MSYLATSPLVLVRIPDEVGDGYRVDYHYAGSVIPWLSDEQREQFLAEGHVQELDESEVAAVHHGGGDHGKVPLKAAPVAAWQEYAQTKGASAEDVEGLTKAELIELYGS